MTTQPTMPQSPIRAAGWQVHFAVTQSAGLSVHLVDFRGRRVLWEGSLPYVTVDHQRQDMTPEDETPDVHGPFWRPLGERSLVGPVRVNELRDGFEICADFDCAPFRYTQMWRFHEDGRMAPWLTIHGPGLHEAHTYHPHWRFDLDVNGALGDAVEYWQAGRWSRVSEEGWLPYTGEASPDGYVWRQLDVSSRTRVNLRPHSAEDAEIFAVSTNAHEAAPFSPRAAAGEPTYPAGYVGAEALNGADVTLWYVGHVHWGPSFPVTAGPWIRVET